MNTTKLGTPVNRVALRMKYSSDRLLDHLLANRVGTIEGIEKIGKKDFDFKVIITLRDKKIRRLGAQSRQHIADLLLKDLNIWDKYLAKAVYSKDGLYDFDEVSEREFLPPLIFKEYCAYRNRVNQYVATHTALMKIRHYDMRRRDFFKASVNFVN